MSFPVLCRAIAITSANKAISFRENGVTSTVNLAEGTYFFRGNGASDDICKAVEDALDSHAGSNTYSVDVTFSIDFDGVSATIVITRATGSDTFQVRWADGATTFDHELIGFEELNTAESAGPFTSTVSPSSCWVSNNVYRRLEPVSDLVRSTVRTYSGRAFVTQFTDEVRDVFWVQELVHSMRFHEEENTEDPNTAFSTFLRACADGTRFEFHTPTLNTGTSLNGLTSEGTLRGTFVFPDSWYPRGELIAERLDGAPLYRFEGRLLEYVA